MIKINLFSEKWKVIPNYSDYAVSNQGRIMRITNARGTYAGKILKLWKSTHGYWIANLSINGNLKHIKVAKIIALTFIGKYPFDKEINHKDGIKINDKPKNLEYITHSQNMLHAHNIGLCNPAKGELQGSSKLKKKDISRIIELRKSGLSCPKIAKQFNVGQSTISDVCLGQTWNWFTKINP